MEAGKISFHAESTNLTDTEKDLYRGYVQVENGIFSMPNEALPAALRNISLLLAKHFQKEVIILIDEYDVPLDKAFQHGYYNEMISLIRTMLGNALKTNNSLKFAVLTGCLRITKESVFTGLNNFKIYSNTSGNAIVRRFIDMAGAQTRNEMEDLLPGNPFPKTFTRN